MLADLYLSDPDAPDGLGVAIWSTHLKDGFLFPASDPPAHFTYQVGVMCVSQPGYRWVSCALVECFVFFLG